MSTAPLENSFSKQFKDRLKDIEKRAKAAGSNMTRVCRDTGVARATFERWCHRAPQTIEKVDELEAYVQGLERQTATTPTPVPH